MPDLITGVRGTEALVSTNIMPDIDRKLLMIDAYRYPLSSWLFLSKKKSKVVKSAYAKFEHFEKEPLPHLLLVAVDITASTTLTVTTTNLPGLGALNLNDQVLVEETGQLGIVTTVTSEAEKVITNIEGGSLTSVTAGTYLRRMGNINYEYGGRQEYKSVKEVNYYNYLNIFKYNVKTSGRQQAGEYWTDGMTHDELVETSLREARGDIERYFWFAPVRGYKTSGNERATYGYGIEPRITTNVTSYSGALTEPILRAHLIKVFRRTGTLGSNRKIHFAGENQMSDIESFINEKYELRQSPGESSIFKEFGAEAKTFRTFNGTTTFVFNPIFDGKYVNYGFTIDEDSILLRHMANDKKGSRKFRMRPSTNPDIDGLETELLFDVGIDVYGEMMCGKLYGT